MYEPLAWLAKGAQYVAFGLQPRGFVAVSVALHTAARARVCPVAALFRRDTHTRTRTRCARL